MKYCTYCGKENRDQAGFCGHCGKQFTSHTATQPPPTSGTTSKATSFTKRLLARWKIPIALVVGFRLIFFLSQEFSSGHRQLEKMGIPFTAEQFLHEVEDGNTKVVELFLSAGMDANTTDFVRQKAVALAVKEGRTNTVKALLDYGADANAEVFLWGPVLMVAASNGYTEIVQALLEHGAYVNAKNGMGRTALREARSNKHEDTVRVLQQAGAVN